MLPNLPIKHKKKEAELGTYFRNWVSRNKILTGTYELKDSRGKDYVSYSEITADQINSGLRTISDKGNLIRVTMGDVGAADYVYFKNCPAYIVVRYPSGCYLIGLETLLLEKERNKRKSLTSERAEAIAIRKL